MVRKRETEKVVNVNDLVGASDLADRLGLAHVASLHKIRARHADFPPPLTVINGTHLVWSWPKVEEWGKATGRLDEAGQPVNKRDD